jgi:hypothetical protein
VSSRGAEGCCFGVHRPGGCYQHPSGHSIFMAGARAEQNSRPIARASLGRSSSGGMDSFDSPVMAD